MDRFMPHGMCYLWKPELLWLHAIADGLIALSYFAIPFGLLYIVHRKRGQLPFHWMFLLFAIFIVACGLTHVMGIWTLWNADYWESGGVKVVTAVASMGTAFLLIPSLPRLVAMKSPLELERMNQELATAQLDLREKVEQLAETNAELALFGHVASHDLREPLRTVASNVQILARRLDGETDEAVRRHVRFAVDGVQRMQALIDAIQAYGLAGSDERPLAPVAAGEALSMAIENLRATIEETGALVEAEPLPVVRGDLPQLAQLFQNLLANALKFRPEETFPQVRISARRAGEEWLFSFRDEGIGIDAAEAEDVFRVFHRLPSAAAYPGTGMGLAICRKIVARHQGRMWVESGGGRGSTFWFSLPDAGA